MLRPPEAVVSVLWGRLLAAACLAVAVPAVVLQLALESDAGGPDSRVWLLLALLAGPLLVLLGTILAQAWLGVLGLLLYAVLSALVPPWGFVHLALGAPLAALAVPLGSRARPRRLYKQGRMMGGHHG